MTRIFILHLEDSVLDAELVCKCLRKDDLKFEYSRVDGRDEFIAALETHRHSVILADHSLPSFDGLSALELARKLTPDTPFLFVSGVLGEEVAIEMLKRGATDYVLKQRLDRLGPAVRRALTEASERAERRRAEVELLERERMHRLILDSVKDYAIMTMDTEGRLTSWNSGATNVLGYRESEILGQPHSILFTAEDIQADIPRRELNRAGRPTRGDDERWHVRKDGTRFWGSGLVMPLLDNHGQLKGYTKVIRDMTERKKAEEALKEADRRKDEFLAMLAHELRNPLSAIHNSSQLALRPGLSPERLSWTKEVIVHQVKHLSRLVDDLLDVSRITRGKIRLRPEWVELGPILARAVETTRPQIEEQRHTLNLSIPDEPLELMGDPTRLEQIFVNLLTNAAKYTETGGRIDLSARFTGHEFVISVRDNGVGIESQMLPRIFDLFSQVDQSLDRSQGGLGIGLTIVHKLVELHGGRITASSEGRNCGSEFTIRLPASKPHAAEPAGISPPPSSQAPRPGSSVLVVDDNMDTANALSELLQISGYEVHSVHNGLEALTAARDYRPEVVLLDIGLPGMDGYQVAEQLRRDERLKAAFIVAITGYGEEQAIRRSREAGFDHHLVKPVDYDTLLSILARRDAVPT
ncbi:response regulator [Tundrisphaera sp. TA3]|uniref:hybrid sensor histidine kinase/response regulator n=1 Tax=Tundrisphaera sp. TA3 TaxID=3435775 RepID=UPI003EB84036